METKTPVREGRIPFKGATTWYQVIGDEEVPGKLPLVCLHGGPGAAHDYLEPMAGLARGRRVVFYDQLGCGRSPYREDPSMWTVELFLEELGEVREALGLDRLHLFGNSWGGMLAMEYALTEPVGLASLVLASSPASIPLWLDETARLRAQLPPEVQDTLARHEEAGTTDDPAYEEACMAFYERHVCRVVPFPDYVMRSFAQMPNQVYLTMNGPSEFHTVGTLRTWDITDRLGEIRVPTLVTSGRHDECTPLIAETVQRGIPGAEWVLFEGSSHVAHAEETERYLGVVDGFLCRVEEAASEAA
jgi:proline-specific peptidase